MIKIENFKVVGWDHALMGMRNPKNSWSKSDSDFYGSAVTHILDENGKPKEQNVYFDALNIGPNDHDLIMRLVKGGSVHAKFRRMITVYVDITAPLYWWKEFDTYKVGTVANSCSTMHKIHAKEFTLEDFSCEHLSSGWMKKDSNGFDYIAPGPVELMETTVKMLNNVREKYLETKNKNYWWQMIQLLPSSYNQKRTVMLNYEVLANIYESRRNHKLDEWHVVCDWIKQLPYSEIITTSPGHNVFYICDGKECETCNNIDCQYTSDILHAKNFKEMHGAYWETEPVFSDSDEDDYCEACMIDFGEDER